MIEINKHVHTKTKNKKPQKQETKNTFAYHVTTVIKKMKCFPHLLFQSEKYRVSLSSASPK